MTDRIDVNPEATRQRIIELSRRALEEAKKYPPESKEAAYFKAFATGCYFAARVMTDDLLAAWEAAQASVSGTLN